MASRTDSAQSDSRHPDTVLRTVAWISGILVATSLVVAQFIAEPPPEGAGELLPRMRPPPTTTAELLRSVGVGSVVWCLCIASAPVFLWLGRRVPIDRGKQVHALAAQGAAVVAMVVLASAIQFRVSYHGSPLAPPLRDFMIVAMLAALLPFLAVALATHALDARARAQARALDAERVRSQLAESRLEALTAQLQPHFLFNTLQGISTLIHRDPESADAMLGNLSDLLRDVLKHGGRHEVPLTEEMGILTSYLDISRRRFGDRLTVRVQIEEAASRALVPFFILQPLVENALHHGISSHAGPGTITISARASGLNVELSVADDGPSVTTSEAGRGIGLANTRARLAELYGECHALRVERPANGGFVVIVSLPLREAATP